MLTNLADEAQVAIFDATNSTEERREKLVRGSAVYIAASSKETACHGQHAHMAHSAS